MRTRAWLFAGAVASGGLAVHATYALLPSLGPFKSGAVGPLIIAAHTWIMLTIGGRWDRLLTEKRFMAQHLAAMEVALKAFIEGRTCLDCGHVHPGGRTKDGEQPLPPHGVN